MSSAISITDREVDFVGHRMLRSVMRPRVPSDPMNSCFKLSPTNQISELKLLKTN